MFRKRYHKFKNIVNKDRNDGCEGIHKTTRLVYPILMEYAVELLIHKQCVSTPLPVHDNKLITFVDSKDMKLNPLSTYQHFDLFLGSMLEWYKQVLQGRTNDWFNIHHEKVNNKPFVL